MRVRIAIAAAVILALLAASLVAGASGPSQVGVLQATVSPVAYLALILEVDALPPTPPPRPEPTNTPTATVPPLPQPSATPSLPPPTLNNCQADPNPGAAPNYPVRITNIDKQAETVTLRNVTVADTIDLSDWTMCSILGNQQHPIGGVLAPGQSQTFPGPAANIWNNSSSDPGALYNADGQLASYWPD